MKVLDLRKGEWNPLDDETLERLTVEAERPGRFGMRLLAAEVHRLRAKNNRWKNLLRHLVAPGGQYDEARETAIKELREEE